MSAPQPAAKTLDSRSIILDTLRLYGVPYFDGQHLSQVQWSPNGQWLSYIRSDGASSSLMAYDPATKNNLKLFQYNCDVSLLVIPTARRSIIPVIAEILAAADTTTFQWTPDSRSLVLMRHGVLNQLFLLRVSEAPESDPQVLVTAPGPITEYHVSPDGRTVSLAVGYNLYLTDLYSGRTIPLTTEGNEGIRIATPDQTNELLASGHWWSPDSARIACLVTDQRRVAQIVLQDITSWETPIFFERFSRPGQNIASPAVMVLGPQGRVWLNTAAYADGYLAGVRWMPDSRHLALQFLNRAQNRLTLLLADSWTGATFPILTESDPAWVNPCNDLRFLGDGRHFLWTSERTSFRQLYLMSLTGGGVQLTHRDESVLALAGVDEKKGLAYYLTSPAPYTDIQVRRVSLAPQPDGDQSEAVTTDAGAHLVAMSPSHESFADIFSTQNQPAQLFLRTADGTLSATLEANPDGIQFAQTMPQYQFVAGGIPAATQPDKPDRTDGVPLCARIMEPQGREPGKKYPVLIYVYGGPLPGGAGLDRVVVNFWQHSPDLWLRMLAQYGFGIFSIDNRGSSGAARGHNFETPIHQQLGRVELADQAEGIKYLHQLDWVDPQRIAVFGGSFGGFMSLTMLARAPENFRLAAAAAFAPVVGWEHFDALYTERYMGMPAQNADGYHAADVEGAAGAIDQDASLLLVHGSDDLTVHLTHSMRMIEALQEANAAVPGDLMVYPHSGHASFFDFGSKPAELFTKVAQFLVTNVRDREMQPARKGEGS
jgi:dipeptidyl-peptidase-4